MKFEVYCKYEDFSYRLNFYIFSIDERGKKSFCTSFDKMEFEDYTPGEYINKPTFCLSGPVTKPFLQAMANELKELGIKPEDRTESDQFKSMATNLMESEDPDTLLSKFGLV